MLIMTRDNSGNPDWQALATLIERAGLGARAHTRWSALTPTVPFAGMGFTREN
ncbi:FIG00554753: hypothetical protein [Cronobacter dublinensis 1210]|uniref:Uncharacterized protein n=1 Tax=Cronobacter dublinensis 1210 TaxID=1208656 RepID=A0ABP1W817_9ENTR|nr:FIG00554753: hypothetical protein [Cronobacter dublinensis 1210]